MSNTLYESDLYAWANEQAALLRSGRVSEADVENIAEEIESMGKSEKRELVGRLEVLLLHLLKWRFQPMHRSMSWRLTIEERRDKAIGHLEENPSLKRDLPELSRTACRYAAMGAQKETGLASSAFPPDSPWEWEQIADGSFFPD